MADHALELKSETLDAPAGEPQAVMKAGPGDVLAAAEMAAALRELGRLDEAEAVCQAMLREYPDSAETHVALGHCARARGGRLASLAHFQAAVAADPRHIWAINEAAADLRALGRLDEAEAGYRRLLEISPGHAHGQLGLGYCARQRGDRAASLALFQAAAAADPGFTWARMEVAADLRELGRLDEAEAVCRGVLAARPNDAEALVALGHCARARGDRAAALAHFQAGAAADPENIWAVNEITHELREGGDPDAARDAAEAALRRHPDSLHLMLSVGLSERAAGRHAEALAAFAAAQKMFPEEPGVLVEMALEERALGRQGRCDELLARALALDPRCLPAILCQAEQALMAARPEQALALLARASLEQPEQVALPLAAADALAALGRRDEAFALLAGTETRFGPLPVLLAKRLHLLRQAGDLHEALRASREVTARLPHFFSGWVERFHAELLVGAEADVEACLARMPAGSAAERASVTRFRGNFAESQWRIDEAIALYEAAAETLREDAGLQHELVRARLLRLDVPGAILHLRRAVALSAHQTRLLRKSLNISQTHFGQVIDDYRMDDGLLNVLISVQKLEPAARADVLGYVLREAPDSTAAAVALMVALRQAGFFSARRDGGGGIPRRVVQFWDSGTPPEDVAGLMRSWRAHNPGYEHHVFNEVTAHGFLAARFPESVPRAFLRAREPAQKADIFRLAVLAAAGGVYADADDKCLQPIDSIVPETAELVVYQEDHGTLGNNFIAARPGQKMLARALEMAVTAVNRGDGDIAWLATGPGLLTRAFGQRFAPGAAVALPAGVVVLDRRELFQAVAIHCAAGYKRTERHWSNTAFARRRGVSGA